MLSLLIIIYLCTPIFFSALLVFLWFNSYFISFYIVSLLLFILTIFLSKNITKTGITPSCIVVVIYAIDLMLLLIISVVAMLLSISRLVAIDILQNKDTYYFMLISIPLSLSTIANVFYTRKGYFEESMQEKLNEGETTNLAIHTLFLMVICVTKVPSFLRFGILLISAIMKYFIQTQIHTTPIMDAVVLSIALDTLVKPYCRFVPKEIVIENDKEKDENKLSND